MNKYAMGKQETLAELCESRDVEIAKLKAALEKAEAENKSLSNWKSNLHTEVTLLHAKGGDLFDKLDDMTAERDKLQAELDKPGGWTEVPTLLSLAPGTKFKIDFHTGKLRLEFPDGRDEAVYTLIEGGE